MKAKISEPIQMESRKLDRYLFSIVILSIASYFYMNVRACIQLNMEKWIESDTNFYEFCNKHILFVPQFFHVKYKFLLIPSINSELFTCY